MKCVMEVRTLLTSLSPTSALPRSLSWKAGPGIFWGNEGLQKSAPDQEYGVGDLCPLAICFWVVVSVNPLMTQRDSNTEKRE